MKKRLFSLLFAIAILVTAVPEITPVHVHASGWKCGYCDTWYPEDDDVLMCFNCYICEECAVGGVCDDCKACMLCAQELGFHCPECGEKCVDESYGNYPHCVSCMRCEDCAGALHETPDGPICDDCLEERQDNEFNILCPHCETVVIGTTLDDVDADFSENLGDCGEHCVQCFEKFVCPECDECTLCSGNDLCEDCGICLSCAMDNGYHCPDCGDCYSEAGQCPDGGEHCRRCCEDICENCDTCTIGAEIEYCEDCHKCENCWEHCELCDECYENVPQCEEGGNHCKECCIAEGWICEQCERCTEALELAVCEYCGLCEECCKENSKYYGVSKCILDDETKPEDLDASKHDKNHHIIVYECVDDGTHDGHCIFPGCGYTVSNLGHDFIWKETVSPTITSEGKQEGICVQCGHKIEKSLPRLNPPEFCFVEQPSDISAMPNAKYITFYVKIADKETSAPINWGFYTTVAAFPVTDGVSLPDTVSSDLYPFLYDDEIRTRHYAVYGMSYEAGSGVFPCVIFPKSYVAGSSWEGKSAQGKTLTWRLAVYDVRGGKITYSAPFVIDWNAKHNEHTPVYVCGKLSKYEVQTYGTMLSGGNKQYYDGTYHWLECSVCKGRISIPENHHYVYKGWEGTCQSGVKHYECKECGHRFDVPTQYDETKHNYSDSYKYNAEKHWKYCTNEGCNVITAQGAHDFDVKIFKSCTKTITTYKCKVCGYTHMEHDSGSGHKYANDGPLKGWYGNTTHHWKVCTECGYVNKEAHKYKDGFCTVCGEGQHQMIIVGTLCQHGELYIERSDELGAKQKERFDAGRYGVTWIYEDTGDTAGVGKTYELGPEDEGRSLRAEITFMDTAGWDPWEIEWNAYMEGLTVSTKFITVSGYAATCASEGVKDHKICTSCGKKFIGNQEVTNVTIPKLTTHTYDNACDAFCNVCGLERTVSHSWESSYEYTEGGHCHKCSVCGIFSGMEPHQLTVTVKTDGDCEHDGAYNEKCVCGYDQDKSVPATGHSWKYAGAVPSLCIISGFAEHYYCENCYKTATDKDGKNIVGIKKLELPLDPNNHIGGEGTGYNAEQHYTICQCGEHINHADHTFNELLISKILTCFVPTIGVVRI